MTAADPFRILVTGSRHCTEAQAALVREHLRGTLLRFRSPAVVVHGQCPSGGVDLVAHRFAEAFPDASPEPHPADWGAHGRGAGPIRNQTMVDLGAGICLAFPGLGSRGTWDCVRKAADAGIPVQVWPLCRIGPQTAPIRPLSDRRREPVGEDTNDPERLT